MVGGVGFTVDAGLLLLGIRFGFDPLIVRIASVAAAGLATWQINRHWTFSARRARGSKRAQAREGLRYGVVQSGGALLNYAVFALIVSLWGRSAEHAMVALVAGSSCGLLLNFLGAKFLVFRAPTA